MVFAHMKQFLDQKTGMVTANDWKNQFESIEVGQTLRRNLQIKHA